MIIYDLSTKYILMYKIIYLGYIMYNIRQIFVM